MNRLALLKAARPIPLSTRGASWGHNMRLIASCCALAALLFAGSANAQITINSKTGTVTNESTGKTINTINARPIHSIMHSPTITDAPTPLPHEDLSSPKSAPAYDTAPLAVIVRIH